MQALAAANANAALAVARTDKATETAIRSALQKGEINCPAPAAARAERVEPGRPCDQRGPDRRRPQHVPAGDKLLIPALDDGLRLGARGGVGNLPLGLDANVEPARPDPYRRSIGRDGPQSKPANCKRVYR